MLRLLALCACLLLPATAFAKVGPGNAFFSFTGAYMQTELKATGESINGNAATLTLEVFDRFKPVSVFFALTWASTTDESTEAGNQIQRTLSTYPLFIGAKGYLGKGRLKGSGGLGIGLYFSEIQATALDTELPVQTESNEGFGFIVPINVLLSLTNSFHLQAGYTLNYLVDNEFLKDGLMQAVSVGVGLSWGGN